MCTQRAKAAHTAGPVARGVSCVQHCMHACTQTAGMQPGKGARRGGMPNLPGEQPPMPDTMAMRRCTPSLPLQLTATTHTCASGPRRLRCAGPGCRSQTRPLHQACFLCCAAEAAGVPGPSLWSSRGAGCGGKALDIWLLGWLPGGGKKACPSGSLPSGWTGARHRNSGEGHRQKGLG